MYNFCYLSHWNLFPGGEGAHVLCSLQGTCIDEHPANYCATFNEGSMIFMCHMKAQETPLLLGDESFSVDRQDLQTAI